jgi:glycosyltransferase involved in cell wall biosynthesis
MIAQSPYRDRFHMLGWRPWSELAGYYRESDVGLNIDALHYETVFGTRTRLVEMIGNGLPIVTSLGCDLSEQLRENGAALTFKSGDWKTMGEQIQVMANDKNLLQRTAQKAVKIASIELSFARTTASVRAWVKSPVLAPDHAPDNKQAWSNRLEYKLRSIIRQMIWKVRGVEK